MTKLRAYLGLAVLASCCLLQSTACTVDDTTVSQIGSTRLQFVDSGLRQQRIEDAAGTIQAAEWKLQSAQLVLGDQTIYMLFGGPCRYRGTAVNTPRAEGRCSAGVVVGSSDVPVPLTLEATFSMAVRRAKPLVLQPGGDFDGDGILDDGDFSGSISDSPCRGGQTAGCDDNCVLIVNGNQADDDGDGIGNGCASLLTGEPRVDSDADGVPDIYDNCVWVYNPIQADTEGFTDSGLSDGIGDACDEQIAVVVENGDVLIRDITFEGELTQPLEQVSLLTIDFDNREALQCNWDAGTCELDPDKVRFCVITDNTLVSGGCP